MQVYQSGVKPLAKGVSEGIKQNLSWWGMASFTNPAGEGIYEFSLTRVKGTDFVSFILNRMAY